jgi:hypothetical protein
MLDTVNNYLARKAISCVRLSAHSFDIEIGRRNNTLRNLRVCSFYCNSGDDGDELHTIFMTV